MQEKPSFLTKRLALFLFAMALVECSRTLTMVQVPVYLSELGAGISQIGLFFTVSAIIPLGLRILGGYLSDTIGRLRALWFGSLAGILGYIAFTISPTWQFAIAGPAMLGMASALVYPSYKAYIADNTSEDVRGRVFGLSETVVTIAWIVGPPLGGWVAQTLGYRSMFAVSVITYTSAAILFALLQFSGRRSETTPQRVNLESLRTSLKDIFALTFAGGLLTWVLITDGIVDVASKMSFDLMPIYLSNVIGLSKQDIGFLDGIHGIALALTTFPIGYLIDKTSERFGILLGSIFVISSRLVFALASNFWGFAISWSLLAIAVSFFGPALNSLVSKGVPKQLRGIAYGFVITNVGIVSLPFPWIGSQIWNLLSPKAPFFISAIMASLLILPAWFKLVVPKRTTDQEDHPA
ncbi:MAG: MFS transporter [Anaerolineales bacterium]|jgi:MFS family permease